MNARISALIISIVLSFSAAPASAATWTYDGHCCNDGPQGDCAYGQAGAKEYAEAWANYHQDRDEHPSTDLIREKGEQHGCYQYCECSISEQRLWNFEYDHLALTEPFVQYKRTVTWTECSISV